ncbi:MAG TPA: Ppx/GppA family phosphatase, partial [Rhodobiaceae bacterium]|nr:Ppx/GppA family phosphatase [Rhodobiaceae bacterium]
APLFANDVLGETEEEARLRHAACILADIGWYVHPDYRAHHAMTQILLAPFSGIDHQGRLYLARVGYHRHEGRGEPEMIGNLSAYIPERDNDRALTLGLALRLAFTLSGATMGMLPKTRFEVGKNTLTLILPKKYEALAGEIVVKRLAALAKALGRKSDIRIGK